MQQLAGSSAGRVVIGMDPHKRSVTIEVMAADETVVGVGRFGTDVAGFAAMRAYVNQLQPVAEDRIWAVEGCNGIGHHVAVRLLAAGEQILDVSPSWLSACARVFAAGQGRKTTPPTPTRSRWSPRGWPGCGSWSPTGSWPCWGGLADRRRSLGEDHTRVLSQLHHLLLELIPGGAKKDLSAAQARTLLAKVRPRYAAGKTRRRVAAELISDLERIHARKKTADKELRDLVAATGTGLLDLHGLPDWRVMGLVPA